MDTNVDTAPEDARRYGLEALLKFAQAVSSESDTSKLLALACETAASTLGLDHSGVALFDAEYRLGNVVAEFPVQAERYTEIPLRSIAAERRLVESREPLIVNDVFDTRWDSELGSIKGTLVKFGIHSMLAVPILGRERLLGSLSVDALGRRHTFTHEEVQRCSALAAMLAPAIERSEVIKRQNDLRNAAISLEGVKNRRDLLTKMVDRAVYLTNAKSGGYYEYSPLTTELTVVAEHNRPRHLGRVLKAGEGIAGHLVLRGEPDYEIVDDYNRHPDRAQMYTNGRVFGSVIEVLVKSEGRLHGVLYVDDRVERRFTRQEALFLRAFVERAAASIDAVNLVARCRDYEVLRRCSDAIMEAANLQEGLDRLAATLVTSWNAAFCRILLLDSSRSSLFVETAVERSLNGLPAVKWRPGTGESADVRSAGLRRFTEQEGVAVLDSRNEPDRAYLSILSKSLELNPMLTHLAVIPLCSGKETVGLIELGDWYKPPFPIYFDEHRKLAAEIGSHIGSIIQRTCLLDMAERRQQLLLRLQEKSRYLRAKKEPEKLRQEIVRLAVELLEGQAGGLCEFDPVALTLKVVSLHGLPLSVNEKTISGPKGALAKTASTGIAAIVTDATGLSDIHRLTGERFHTVLCASIRRLAQTQLVLFVCFDQPVRPTQEADLDALERFADMATLALRDSILVPQDGRRAELFALYYHAVRFVFSTRDRVKIQHAVLTAITAEYGFGFNRAGVLLFDERLGYLVGTAGIGPLVSDDLPQSWPTGRARVSDYSDYLERFANASFPVTKLDAPVRGLTLQALSTAGDLISRAAFSARPTLVNEAVLSELPAAFLANILPESEVIFLPLTTTDEKKMGLLFADNKFTRAPITPQDLELLSIFADLLALALRNHSEFGEFAQAMVQIEQLNRTILDLTPSQDPESFLADAVEQICLNGSAAGAALILVDDGSLTVQKVICAGTERATIPVAIRPDGISVEAMRTGSPVAIQDRAAERDRLNPETLQNNYVSSLCLPVRYHGRVAGVLWVHYTEMQPFNEGKRSTEQTLAALRIYADHALLVYHNACRIQQQQDLIKAAEEISNERTVVDVCRRAVHCADGLFGADFCTFWPYDSVLDRFESEHAASTIQEKVDPSVKLREPRPGGATFLVLRAKYLEVESVEPKSAFGMSSKPYGIKSFQAVLVEVGSEPVGVLYVSYRSHRLFSEEDRTAVQQFAALAAPAIRRARLLDQLTRAKRAAEVVAEITASGDIDSTVQAVAEGTRNALPGSRAVVVYSYDPYRRVFAPTPGYSGERSTAWSDSSPAARAIAEVVLRREGPYIAEDTSVDDLFKAEGSSSDSGGLPGFETGSCIAVPLRLNEDRVGVIFVGYPNSRRKFTTDAVNDIKMFANQAALAVGNAQLRMESVRQRERLTAIGGLSQELMGSVGRQETMDRALRFVAQTLDAEFASIVFSDTGEPPVLASVHGWDRALQGNLIRKKGRDSHAGYVILMEKPVPVEDFSQKQAFDVPDLITNNGIKSGVGVPIRFESAVIGAMLVHTRTLRRFTDEEMQFLTVAATETAVALNGAGQYENLVIRQKALGVVNQLVGFLAAGSKAEPDTEPERVLKSTVEYFRATNHGELAGTVYMYDPQLHELSARLRYPIGARNPVVRLDEGCYYIDGERKGDKIGIAGLVFREGRSARFNVRQRPEYIDIGEAIESAICLPLIDGNIAVGVLCLESDRADAFSEDDEHVLKTFGDLIVLRRHYAELTELWQAARHQVEQRDELLLTTAHQMKGPLDPVDWAIESLADYFGALPPETQRQRARIEKELDLARDGMISAKRLVRNVLEGAVEDTTRESPPLAVGNVNDVAQRIVSRYESQANRKKIALTHSIPTGDDGPLMVRMSDFDLEIVLENLVDNAVKYTPDGGHVSVSAAIEGSQRRYVKISVHDDGPGIPEHQRMSVFERFYRVGHKPGIGLGLHICSTRVTACGGKIWVAVGPSGKGTSVCMLVPEGGES